MSESGKTTLAKMLSHALHGQSKNVIVLDPMNDPGWAADYRTSKKEEFLEVFWTNQSCFVFIDESGKMVGRYDELMQELATSGRHHGHSVFFVSQRGAQISATVRAQCRHVYLFNSNKSDCKTLSEEFNQEELLKANKLPQFYFYHASRFGGCTVQKLEDPRNVRPVQSVSSTEDGEDSPGTAAAGSPKSAPSPAAAGSPGTAARTAATPGSLKHS